MLFSSMVRKGAVILLGALVGLFLVVASWPYWSYESETPTAGFTGNSISEAVGSFYETSSINQRIFILAQVFLLIIIAVAVFIVFGKLKSKEILSKTKFVKKSDGKRSHTDLDVLYDMLKTKGEIDLEDVEGAFKISPQVAIGWAKVLENGDLAEIDYPRFGKPVLRLPRLEMRVVSGKNGNEIGGEEKVAETEDVKGGDKKKKTNEKVRKNIKRKNVSPKKKKKKSSSVKKKIKKRAVVKKKAIVKKKVVKNKAKGARKVKKIKKKK